MHSELLLQLATHLESGKLGHAVFDFRRVNSGTDGLAPTPFENVHKCGTNGCAMGEMPIIWPNDWEFYFNSVQPIKNKDGWLKYEVSKWFDISELDVLYLFFPEDDDVFEPADFTKYNEKRLPSSATKEQVATHIRNFVKLSR